MKNKNPLAIISDPAELLPHVRKKLEEWISKLKDAGVEVRVVETYRTPERQQQLFDRGATKAKPWRSWHQLRRAWDAYPVVNGKTIISVSEETIPLFTKMGEAAKELGITWGGNWKIKDYGHFEVRDGLTLAQAVELHKTMEEIA